MFIFPRTMTFASACYTICMGTCMLFESWSKISFLLAFLKQLSNSIYIITDLPFEILLGLKQEHTKDKLRKENVADLSSLQSVESTAARIGERIRIRNNIIFFFDFVLFRLICDWKGDIETNGEKKESRGGEGCVNILDWILIQTSFIWFFFVLI